jgi:hypothetical protein
MKEEFKEIAFVEKILEKSYLQVVKSLKEAKVPCRIELTKDEVLIVGGESLSESFKDKVFYELAFTDVPYIEIKFSKTSSNKNILKFTEIAGGPVEEVIEEMVGLGMEYLVSYPEGENNIVKENKIKKEQTLNAEYLDSLSEEIQEWFENYEDELKENDINTYEGYASGARCSNLANVSHIVGKNAFNRIKYLGEEFDETYPKVYSENGNLLKEDKLSEEKIISRNHKPTEEEMELAFDTLRKNGVNTQQMTWGTLEDIYKAMEEYKILSKKKNLAEDKKPELPNAGDVVTVKGFGDVKVKSSYFDTIEDMNAISFKDLEEETRTAFYDKKHDYWFVLID